MGGTSAYLSASQPVSPPGHLHPPAALAASDQFRANSGPKPQEYSGPTLGVAFLRFAEVCFVAQRTKLEKAHFFERELRRRLIEHRT
jgi:hypothetical protein